MVSSGAEKTRGRTGAGTHLGTGFRACLARERGRGDPSGLLGLRSAGHARSHDHAGGAAGGPLAGNPAPATIIRAVASPGRGRAGEREGCRAHVADTRARSRVRSMRGPSRYVREQTPSRKVAYHRARAGITVPPRPVYFAGLFPRRENSLSCVPARCDFFFRKERASCGRSAGASEQRCAGAKRGTGPKTRVHASAPECVSRYAATRPCSPRNRPRSSGVSFLTTKFLAYGTTLRDQAQPFVWHTGRLITGWRKISGALIGHSPWV